jgi:hypothetical protein
MSAISLSCAITRLQSMVESIKERRFLNVILFFIRLRNFSFEDKQIEILSEFSHRYLIVSLFLEQLNFIDSAKE